MNIVTWLLTKKVTCNYLAAASFDSNNILKKLGGFDERFFLYFEDFDLSLRASEHGRVVNAPRMVITHLE